MARRNPTKEPLTPHIIMVRGGRWHAFFRTASGYVYSATEVSWMTANSVNATKAYQWCASRNARIVANLGAHRG